MRGEIDPEKSNREWDVIALEGAEWQQSFKCHVGYEVRDEEGLGIEVGRDKNKHQPLRVRFRVKRANTEAILIDSPWMSESGALNALNRFLTQQKELDRAVAVK